MPQMRYLCYSMLPPLKVTHTAQTDRHAVTCPIVSKKCYQGIRPELPLKKMRPSHLVVPSAMVASWIGIQHGMLD